MMREIANPISAMLIADARHYARVRIEHAADYAREMCSNGLQSEARRADAAGELAIGGRHLMIIHASAEDLPHADQVATDIATALFLVACYPQHLQPPTTVLAAIHRLYDYIGHDTEATP